MNFFLEQNHKTFLAPSVKKAKKKILLKKLNFGLKERERIKRSRRS
jgi:hypothetical protein